MVDKEKQIKRQDNWIRENKERLSLVLPKGTKDAWKDKAAAAGKSLTEYLIDKISQDK